MGKKMSGMDLGEERDANHQEGGKNPKTNCDHSCHSQLQGEANLQAFFYSKWYNCTIPRQSSMRHRSVDCCCLSPWQWILLVSFSGFPTSFDCVLQLMKSWGRIPPSPHAYSTSCYSSAKFRLLGDRQQGRIQGGK